MVRKQSEQIIAKACVQGGIGEAEMHKILVSPEEMLGKGRLFNHIFLNPGCSVGEHHHHGDMEVYYILKGTGDYNDNGKHVQLNAGDTAICGDGEMHGLVNNGDEPIEMIALILYA